jgi:hypothetical protein
VVSEEDDDELWTEGIYNDTFLKRVIEERRLIKEMRKRQSKLIYK